MFRLFNAVKCAFRKHPFISNCAAYNVLFVGADFSQQYIARSQLGDCSAGDGCKHETLDYASFVRNAVMGSAVVALTLFVWYNWLESKFPGPTLPMIAKKLAMDQLLMTPFLIIVSFMGFALMERSKNPWWDTQEQFIPKLYRSWSFWVPVDVFNFWLVAPQYRVIFLGICDFTYMTAFAFFKQRYLNRSASGIFIQSTNK